MRRWVLIAAAGVLLAAGRADGQAPAGLAAMLRGDTADERQKGYAALLAIPEAQRGAALDLLMDVRGELCLRVARELATARQAAERFAGVYEQWEQAAVAARLLIEQSVSDDAKAPLAKAAVTRTGELHAQVTGEAKLIEAALAALSASAGQLAEIDRVAASAHVAVVPLDHSPAALDGLLGGASRLGEAAGCLNRWWYLQQAAAECERLNRAAGAGTQPGPAALLAATNAYRLRLGLMPLLWNGSLARSAGEHAAEMQRLGYVSHTSPTAGRQTPEDRIRAAGYGEYLAIGENVAGGFTRGEAVFAAFRGSPAHHRNLTDAAYRQIGIGVVGDKWAMHLGAPTRSPWGGLRPTVLSWPASRPAANGGAMETE
jgi:hypothetical protein